MITSKKHVSSALYILSLTKYGNTFAGWIAWVFEIESSAGACYMIAYIMYSCSMCSMMLICAMTVDRFIAVTKPLKAAQYCTRRRAILASSIITVLGCSYSIPHFFTSVLRDRHAIGIPRCVSFATKETWVKVYGFVTSLTNSLFPSVFLVAVNAKIIRTLLNRKKFFQADKESMPTRSHSNDTSVSEVSVDIAVICKQEGSIHTGKSTGSSTANPNTSRIEATERTSSKLSEKERQLVLMLLAVSFVFLVLTIPIYIRQFVYQFIDQMGSPDAFALYVFVFFFSQNMYVTNSCVNFYLYCLSGSNFRKDLKYILCKKWILSISYIDGLVQERRNSIANAPESCLSCTIPSI